MNPVEAQLALSLLDAGAIKFGEFRLKLHEKNPDAPLSPIYLNLRTSDNPKPGPLTPEIVDTVGQCMYWLTGMYSAPDGTDEPYDFAAGVPNAGDPFAARFAHYKGLSVLKLKKTENAEGRAVTGIHSGPYKPGGNVALIDDLITQADSKLEAIKVLESQGLRVKDVIVLVDREQGGKEQLAKFGYILHSVFTLRQLLDLYVEEGRLEASKRDEVQAYLAANS
ncbi:hypothetical protein HZC53_04130 [Candidatus Uhrbacteria bacterium]|nr:hypothetical protein [Candidatus Uhrbacteria bacterium]